MKKILFLALAVAAFACNQKKTTTDETSQGTIAADTSTAQAETPGNEPYDSMTTSNVTNNAGSTLKQSYNSTRGTAVFEVNGQTIVAKKDSVPSGIQYSNDHYVYKEHRGDISIYKDGNLFWDNIR